MPDYRNFATADRMVEIANHALDFVAEMFNGDYLYQTLSEDFGMTDDEILAAGFSTLKEYIKEKQQPPEQKRKRHHMHDDAR